MTSGNDFLNLLPLSYPRERSKGELHLMKRVYLLHKQAAKAQPSLHISAVKSEPFCPRVKLEEASDKKSFLTSTINWACTLDKSLTQTLRSVFPYHGL